MWSAVVVLGLLTSLDPMRFGVALLVVSRPRPVQNLLAYWVGCLTAFIPTVAVPLTLLHTTPTFKSSMQNWAASPTVRYIQFGAGVLVLSIAVLMTVRSWARRRAPVPAGGASTEVLDADEPTPLSRLLVRAQEAAAEGGSAFRRLLGRAYTAWENGSLWVALAMGVGLGGVAPELALIVLAVIVASGAAIGTQISAALTFVVLVLAVVEVALVSYLVTPAKTQAVLRPLHDWAWTHRRKIVIAILAVGGFSLVAGAISS